ncbi:MAG TPA: efflux RND transporter periplasmic adaptor subunit [Alphaproteobacteria bacterium]|jgi:multidrug efflux system membrane fusion protein
MRERRIRQIGIGVLLIAVVGLGVHFLLGDGTAAQAVKQNPGAPVVIASAETRDVPIRVSVVGTTQAYATVNVKSQVDGQILSASFKEGQLVKKGDPLFTLDPRPLQAELDQAKAALARDQAQLESADKNLARYKDLAKQGVYSEQQLEAAEATAKSLRGTVNADQAQIEMARLQLEYTQISSPIDGRTGSMLVNPGNLVKANDTTALVTINQIEPIYVAFSVPEKYLAEIRSSMSEVHDAERGDGLEVTATAPGAGQTAQSGVLTFVNNEADSTTGTIELKASFLNSGEAFTPGQLVQVTLTLRSISGAITIPNSAVQNAQTGNYVFLVKPDMTVEQRTIKLGPSVDGYTVITEGVATGDKVVTEGQMRLSPGSKVQVAAPAV